MSDRFLTVPGTPSRVDLRCRPTKASRTALTIYRPSAWQRRVAIRATRLLPMRLWRARTDPGATWLAATVETALGRCFPGLAVMGSSQPGRSIVGLSDGEALRFVAKAARGTDPGLRNEAAQLQLARRRVRTPRTASARFDDEVSLLVTEAVPLAGRAVALYDAVATAIALQGQRTDCPPIVHGDLTVWNLLDIGGGGRLLLDWEAARPRSDPWWDLVHFVASAGELLRAWPPVRAARLLVGDPVVGPLVDAGILCRPEALTELRDCLQRQAAASHRPRRAEYLRAMGAAL